MVGILRDQSEDRKAAENAAAAKDDFLAALSHELRTPLNPALMTIAALESDMSLPESARFSLASARRNIELEAGLIDDVLDATRITRGMISFSPAPCDLHALLARASEIALSDRQRGAEALNLDCGAEEHWVNGEAARLQQILWNLLRNAFKFAESGGTISVRTYNPTADRIVLAVTDSCGALPSDSFGSVSGPSEQTSGSGRQRFGGLSLGLTISKALAELHGGTLRASSNGVGKGTTFLLELPANPAGQLLSETSMPENPVPGPPLRLLLVEDHETSLKALIWHLERDGHTVFPAGSGREALALAEREDCDLIISDIGLPDISGLEVMRQIRRLHGWPGIALSGYGMPGDISASKAAGFSLHLLKPVKLAELRGALKKFGKPGTREWMARWRNLDQKR
ncbi:MAG: response regulator [Verrucomicrobiota bacterium]